MIITAIKSFTANSHDSKTIAPFLNQMQTNLNYLLKEVVYDSGGKGQKEIGQTTATSNYRLLKRDTEYQKRVKREKFRRRPAKESLI